MSDANPLTEQEPCSEDRLLPQALASVCPVQRDTRTRGSRAQPRAMV